MLADDFVRNRSACHRHARHVAARTIDCLADSFRNFIRFSCRESNFALTVTNSDECVEGETTSTLHDFRDAVDCDHVLDELAAAFAASTVATSAITSALSVA